MMKTVQKLACAALAFMTGSHGAFALNEITVGYFLEWPMPYQYAKAKGIYDEELDVKVNWIAFETGVQMSAAMASGAVDLALGQGVPPFVVATSDGLDLQVVDIAATYAENDNCVVADGLGIDKTNAAELAGKKVALPLGTAAHYGFLRQMEHFGVDVGTMEIADMQPAQAAAALAQGRVDMFCGWGNPLLLAQEHGHVLLTGAEKEEVGILVFDVTSGPAEWIAENFDLVAGFVKVTADANAMWADEANREKMLPIIAEDSGMDVAVAAEAITHFTFPAVEDQLSSKWLGGGAQDFMKGVAGVFAAAGSINAARDSYDSAVNKAPLAAASEM